MFTVSYWSDKDGVRKEVLKNFKSIDEAQAFQEKLVFQYGIDAEVL